MILLIILLIIVESNDDDIYNVDIIILLPLWECLHALQLSNFVIIVDFIRYLINLIYLEF